MTEISQYEFDNHYNKITNSLKAAKIPKVNMDFWEKADLYKKTLGNLGPYTFSNIGHGYWIAKGYIPKPVADEIYADPLGKMDVRLDGHCCCVSPDDDGGIWIKYFDEEGNVLVPDNQEKDYMYWANKEDNTGKHFRDKLQIMKFVPDVRVGIGFANFYHIDSVAGLRLYADTIRKYSLDTGYSELVQKIHAKHKEGD